MLNCATSWPNHNFLPFPGPGTPIKLIILSGLSLTILADFSRYETHLYDIVVLPLGLNSNRVARVWEIHVCITDHVEGWFIFFLLDFTQ
jgi:hypothetical protein